MPLDPEELIDWAARRTPHATSDCSTSCRGSAMARTGTSPTTPSYLDLLRKAYDLGRADGVLAADVEPVADPGPPGSCCRGRDAEGFARHLWEGPPGGPPAGLIVNAPAWYGQGFREALAEARPPVPGTTGPGTTGPGTTRPGTTGG